MEARELQHGDVVQLDPEETSNPAFRGCFMVVTEPKPFGAQGFVQALGTRETMGGQAYYRAKWEEMEFIGRAVWAPRQEEDGHGPATPVI